MLSRVSNNSLSQYFKASSNAVRVTQVGSAVPTHYNYEPSFALPDNRNEASSYPLGEFSQKFKAQSISVNFHQKRLAHTDISIPSLEGYRKSSTKEKTVNKESLDERRGFTYLATATFGVGSAIAGKAIIRDLCSIMAPAKEVAALSKIEINLGDIPVGKNVVFKWRGKPIFVKHRTDEDIKREESVDLTTLRDKQHDSDRVKNPEWLVLIGICTHLGCVPLANSGDYFGYFCPCHGSHYDASGRIRRGPAPLNLEVPQYTIDENLLVIG